LFSLSTAADCESHRHVQCNTGRESQHRNQPIVYIFRSLVSPARRLHFEIARLSTPTNPHRTQRVLAALLVDCVCKSASAFQNASDDAAFFGNLRQPSADFGSVFYCRFAFCCERKVMDPEIQWCVFKECLTQHSPKYLEWNSAEEKLKGFFFH